MPHVGHVTLEGHEVEDARSNVCPSDDTRHSLCVYRVSSEEEACDGDGDARREEQSGQADHEAGCQAMQKDVDEMVTPCPEAS